MKRHSTYNIIFFLFGRLLHVIIRIHIYTQLQTKKHTNVETCRSTYSFTIKHQTCGLSKVKKNTRTQMFTKYGLIRQKIIFA